MASAYKVPFLEAIKIRRSIVSLAKESPISDDRIVMIVNHAIKHAPSPFSVDSCRAIVLLGAEHDKLWDMGMEATRKNLPPPIFAQLESKIQGLRDAYGTVSTAFVPLEGFNEENIMSDSRHRSCSLKIQQP